MVAIVSGNSLGLTNTSAGVLGGEGLFGNASTGNADEQAYVNVANGNLVLQDQDDYLASLGTDVALTRTYNSQGVLDATDAIKQWETGLERSVGALTGTVNTAGSTLTRVGADGSRTVFTYDAGRAAYISTDGGGAFDSITYNSNARTYTWRSDAADPNSMSEKYDATNGGRIVSVSEVGGRTLTPVTGSFTVAKSALVLNTVTNESSGTVSIRNTSSAAVAGPIQVYFNNLTPGVTLKNATGYLNSYVPYLTIDKASIAPGETVQVSTVFANPGKQTIDYAVSLASGYDTPVTLIYSYNTAGKIATIQDQSGEITTFRYDTRGNLASVGTSKPAQPGGAAPAEFVRVRYTYDTLNRLTMSSVDLAPEATKPGAAPAKSYATSYTYDGTSNRIASVTQQDGSILRFTYTQTSTGVYKVSTFTDALNRKTSFAYGNNSTTVTDPKGIKTTYQFSAGGNLEWSRVTSASGDETIDGPSYTYDAQGNVTSRSDDNGTTRYTYDAFGSLLTQENPDGAFIYRSYDAANHQLATESIAQPKIITNGTFDDGKLGWTLLGSYAHSPDPADQATAAPFVEAGDDEMRVARIPSGFVLPPYEVQLPGEPPPYIFPSRTYPVVENGVLSFTHDQQGVESKTAHAYQNFATIPGETYEVTVRGQADFGPNNILVTAGSPGAVSVISIDPANAQTDTPETYVLRFVATDVTSGIHFYLTAGTYGGRVSVSDVVIKQAALTRYIYEPGNDKPRFEITPEGRITEWRYNSTNDLVTTIVHGEAYPAYRNASEETLKGMQQFVGGQDKSKTARTDYSYDVRGLLQTTTAYARTDASGAGIADGTASVTHFVYDQAGQLLQAIDPDSNVTTYTYDGLGRRLSTTDAQNNSNITTYDDAGNKVTVKMANGLTRISAFDKAGQLLTTTERGADVPTGITANTYDADGLLRMTENQIGERTYLYYDAAGYLQATIDANGSVVEFGRNDAHQIVRTVEYAAQLTQAQRNALVTSDKVNVLVPFASVRPATLADQNRVSINHYDSSGRLDAAVDANKFVTRYTYDSGGRLVTTTRYATVSTTSIHVPSSPDDRVQRNFYDNDNFLIGTLDPEGHLTEYVYDAHGWKIENIIHAVPVAPENRAAVTVEELDVAASAKDVHEHFLYNGKGQQVGSIDGDGYLTESRFDTAGNLVASTRYANPVQFAPDATIDTLRPAAQVADRTLSYTYNSLNQRVTATGADGTTLTRYEYNVAGALVSTTVEGAVGADTGAQMRYDVQGRVVASLGAEGVAMLPADMEDVFAVNEVWAEYATTYTYDAAGERTSMTDPLGNRTVFFYDDVGRLRYTVSALGNVLEQRYNAFGQVEAIVSHAVTLGASSGLVGGRLTASVQSMFKAINSSADSVQSFVYDHEGQVVNVADAMKFITVNEYDAFGDVVRQTAVAQAGSADPAAPGSISVRSVYDKDGRVVATLDAAGSLASYRYDGLGNVLERVAYATPIDPASTGEQIKAIIAGGALANPAHDARQLFVYNQRGLPTATFTSIDGNAQSWSVSTTSYDAAGTVIATDSYATPVAGADPTALAQPYPASAADSATRILYDQNGRASLVATRTGSSTWSVEQRQYDAAGNMIVSTQFAADFASADPAVELADAGRVAALGNPAADRVTRYAYDSANRVSVRAEAQDGGHWAVTRYTYDQAGKLVETLESANPLLSIAPESAPGAAEYTAWLQAGAPASAADRVTRFGYDAENRLINTLDAMGALVSTTFDAKGNVSATIAYATPLHLVGQLPQDIHPAYDPAVDRVQRTVYDLNNRPTVSIDALGNATGMQYDAFGNMVAMTRYATPLAYPATEPQPDAARDRTERYVYDQAQRLRYTIDAAGYVAESTYDAVGNVATSVTYAAVYGGAADLASLDSARPALVASRIDSYDYDARGLMTLHIDPVLARESFTYDALGNQVSAVNKNGVRTDYTYDSAGRLLGQVTATLAHAYVDGQLAPIQTTVENWIDYDALGNVASRTEVAGGVARTTFYSYDRVGRQTGTSVPTGSVYDPAADPLAPGQMHRTEMWPATGATTSVVYDVLGNAVSNTDALGNITRKVYDQAGRVVADIDALGYVTLQTYDAFGDTVKITRTAAPVLPALALLQGVQLYQLILGRAPEAGAAEAVAAALQSGRTFAQIAEEFFNSPEGANLFPAGMDAGCVVTQLFANAVGRAPSAAELSLYAASLNNGASRGAVADAILHGLGSAADLQVWNAKTEAAAPTAAAAVRQRATQVYTAVLGRAATDAELRSALQFLIDGTPEGLANALIASPEGQQMYAPMYAGQRPADQIYLNITGHLADAQYEAVAAMYATNPGAAALYAIDLVNGENGADAAYFAETVAAHLIPMPMIGAGAGQLDLAGALALLAAVPHNEDRILVQRFDSLGRVLSVTEASGLYSMPTNVGGVAGYGIVQGHKQTTNTYDSFGGMLSQSVGLYDDATGVQMADPALTLFAYNVRGEKVAQFVMANTRQALGGAGAIVAGLQEDVGGYLTTMAYDAVGNLVRVTEFSRLIDPATLVVNGQLAPELFAGVPLADADRATAYTYDGQDNRIAEIHLASDVNQVTLDGAQTVRKDVHTYSAYDLMGNLVSITDELGGATYSYYDSLGQVSAVASSVDGVRFTLTTFERDGFGKVLRRTDHANGATNVSAAGYTMVGPDAANDRVTLSQYDIAGRAIVETDAGGHTLYTSYDLLGRVAKQWQSIEQARLDSNTDLDWGTVFTVNQYDAVGQLVAVNRSGATGTFGSPDGSFNLTRSTSSFNAFGEAVEKRIDGQLVEAARYDTLGRTWLTNADDGAYKAVFYDVQGNATTILRSDVLENVAGSLTTFNSAHEVAAVQGQFIRTDTQFDLMGRMVRANAPGSNVYQRHDRWGNLVERTDPRKPDWSTRYTYNWRNTLIEEANVVKTNNGDAGWSETTAKAVSSFYDELGRNIGMRDGNMNASGSGKLTKTMTYDLQGQVTAEYHADGGLVSSAYNLFGDRVQVAVAVNAGRTDVTWFGYDHLSQMIDTWTAPVETYYLATPTDKSDMRLTSAGAVQLHLHYDYDGLGNRYQTIASDGGVTRSRYDLDGNVVGTRDGAGIVVQYSFDAQHNRTGQLDGKGHSMSWQYDANGKLVSHVDLGGATVWYGYDGRGQLVSQTSTARGGTGLAQDIVSTYDATGLLLTVNDRTSGILTTYTYDLAGNRTGEQTLASSRNTGTLIPNGPQSPERTLVTQLFYAVFDRGIPQESSDFWVGHMRNSGQTPQAVVLDFFKSAETEQWFNPNGTSADFAVALYRQALHRDPNQAEIDVISNMFANGANNGDVVVAFVQGISDPADLNHFNGKVNTVLYFPNDAATPDYGIVAQNNVNVYDNLGRITSINDGRHSVSFTYDANGNRIGVHTHYVDQLGTVDTVAVNTFDAMDRQLIVNGTRDANGNVVIGQYGHQLTYDWVGNRTSDTYLGDPAIAGSLTVERFEYDQAGRLTYTYRTANGTSTEYLINARKYDFGSRIVETGPGTNLDSGTIESLKAMHIDVNSRQYAYDLAGKTLRQKLYDSAAGAANGGKLQDVYYYHADDNPPNAGPDIIGYDYAGNLNGYYIVPEGGAKKDQNVYHMEYARFDSYVQTKLSVSRDNGSGDNYRETISTYNQNGFLVQVQVGYDAPRHFINDINGQILRATSGEEVTNTLIVNGEVLGTSGGPRDTVAPGYFATNYASAVESGAATAPTVYMVAEGDTLQTIARAIWGDARLWYLIADANGISGETELKAGDQLVIPPKVNTVNSNYQAYKPYDPAKLIGETTPELPAPTGGGGGGGGGGGCGILGAIISVFVAVVAFVVLGPVGGAVAKALSLTGTAAAVVAGATTGILASVVSQGIGIAIGTQESFSWKSVAVAGISSGLMGGLNANLAGGTAAAPTYAGLTGTGGVVARAAIGNAVTQGVSIAVGLQDRFNWRGLVASSAAAGVGAVVENRLAANGMERGSFGVDLAKNAASSATQQLVQNGRINLTEVATDGFGNALGNSVASEILAQRAARAASSTKRNFLEEYKARAAMDPLTNGRGSALGDAYQVNPGRSDRDYELMGGLGKLPAPEGFQKSEGELADDFLGPKVYIVGKRMTVEQKLASLFEERILAEYGSRSNYEGQRFMEGARDSVVNSIVGTWRYVSGDQATRTAVAQASNRLSSMPVGSIMNAAGRGFVNMTPIGVLAGFTDGDPYAAGTRLSGAVLSPGAGKLGMLAVDGAITGVSTAARWAAPKAGQMLENYLERTGGVLYAMPPAAKFGNAVSDNYRRTFLEANPTLVGEVVVHHAVEKQVLTKFPGVVTNAEMHSLENLRGIPKELNNTLHLKEIRLEWNRFYKPFIANGTSPTQAQLLQKATELDFKLGTQFNPPIGGK